MKYLIASALILTAGVAQAHSFDYERAAGSADLFVTLATEGAASNSGGNVFAYQQAVGSSDLFVPTEQNSNASALPGERTVFEYQRAVGSQELDPHV